jgi:hypothetical protein
LHGQLLRGEGPSVAEQARGRQGLAVRRAQGDVLGGGEAHEPGHVGVAFDAEAGRIAGDADADRDHLQQRLELRHLTLEVAVQVLDLLLGPLALGDVAVVQDGGGDARVVEPVDEDRLHRAPRAAAVPHAELGHEREAGALQRGLEQGTHLRQVLRVDAVERRAPHHLLHRVAEDGGGGLARIEGHALPVEEGHHLVAVVDEGAEPLLAPLDLLVEPRVADGEGGVGRERLREAEVLRGEESRRRLVDGVEPDDAIGREQRHSHPVAHVFGPRMALPARVDRGVGDQDAAAGREERAEDRMGAHVVDGAPRQRRVGPLLVSSERAHGQTGVALEQHHVGGVVGDQASQVLEQRIEYDVQLEGAGQVEGRRPQDLGGLVAGVRKGSTVLACHVCGGLRVRTQGGDPASPEAGSYPGRRVVNVQKTEMCVRPLYTFYVHPSGGAMMDACVRYEMGSSPRPWSAR